MNIANERGIQTSTVEEYIPLETFGKLDSMEESNRLFNAEGTDLESDVVDHLEGEDEDEDEDDDTYYPFDDPCDKRSTVSKWFSLIVKGPSNPRDEAPGSIKALQYIEDIPTKFRHGVLPKIRLALLVVYLMMWMLVVYHSLISYLTLAPSSSDDTPILILDCGGEPLFWKGKNNQCGLDGKGCPSLADSEDVIIRCPALCERESYTFSFLPVGDQMIKYRGYYIGGGAVQSDSKREFNAQQLSNPYRADSYPCGAAVHAGVVSSYVGGCARVSFGSKGRGSFPGTKAYHKGLSSVSFDSFFPSSYYFKKLYPDESYVFSQCKDPRFMVLAINVLLGVPIVFMASGAVMFWTMSVVAFWTICMATDPPMKVEAADPETLANLTSLSLGRFLPTCCILSVLWKCSIERTLGKSEDNDADPDPRSPLQRLVLWYPLFWVGVLNNLTFDRLHLDRFTWTDLKLQPGSMAVGVTLTVVVAICCCVQAYHIWRSGRFIHTLLIYVCFVVGLILIGCLPGLTLRIHHYILAMLLIPGCATRGRTALLFQGLLLGLFISGASRWGLASIAETTRVLLRDDPIGTIEPPLLVAFDSVTGLLSWTSSQAVNTVKYQNYYDGIALMINDVEAYIGLNQGSLNLTALLTTETYGSLLKLSLNDTQALDANQDVLVYLRIAMKIIDETTIQTAKAMGLPIWSDFSRAGVLKWPSGEFTSSPTGLT